MVNAVGSTWGGPKRRAPRMWALRLAVVAMAAAVVATMGALRQQVTVADRHRKLQAVHTGSPGIAELSRDCRYSVPCKACTGFRWWIGGEQLWRALPSRVAVAWSMAARQQCGLPLVYNRVTNGTAWWSVGDQFLTAIPARSAVAWSLTAGAISLLDSQRSLSLNRRPWLPIAIITGESARTASENNQQA
jgi:hypothetical protein